VKVSNHFVVELMALHWFRKNITN